ncbi:MAG: nicotinate phosphoribosyltransferase [Myxococcota bacterium]
MTAPLLATDGYKFSMGEAGWPLRRETFYYSHRKGGLQVLPFDVAAELAKVLPAAEAGDWAYLAEHEYEMGSGYREALREPARKVTVRALPRFSVFSDREPVFSVTGPSALVSWLEPLLLQWSYRIQVATVALREPQALAASVGVVTCEAQKQLVLETLDAVGVPAPPVEAQPEAYVARVRARVLELAEIVGTPARLFEVGLRAASCLEQHLLALEGCRQAGLTRTSHVWGARKLGLVPVGTMGHEHVQRFGSDEAAFRAMVDRRPQRSSFLLDTFDTITSGLPTAFAIMKERPGERDSIRYDSGDKEAQYRHAVELARKMGLEPVHILEDGFDAEQTRRFEALRAEVGLSPGDQVYGYGGYLVAQTAATPLTRDRVAAVYKLSQSGPRPTMKFGNEPGSGKQSVPGRPVLFRRRAGASGPFGVVGQEGEAVPAGYELLTGAEPPAAPPLAEAQAVAPSDRVLALSPETKALVDALTRWRTPS